VIDNRNLLLKLLMQQQGQQMPQEQPQGLLDQNMQPPLMTPDYGNSVYEANPNLLAGLLDLLKKPQTGIPTIGTRG
jgi:hypothetical protein